MMPSSGCLQRKYVDLINSACSNWVNWDFLVNIRVGAYGSIDEETGNFRVEGNIYDPEFQEKLYEHGVEANMSDFPPEEGQTGDDLVIVSQGVTRGNTHQCNLCIQTDTPEPVDGKLIFAFKKDKLCDRCLQIDTREPVDGQWIFNFKRGRRGGVLIMHRPREISLPSGVLEPLYRIDKLRNKWLVTSAHACPAYSMYLSDKSGDKVTLTYVPECPIAGVTVTDADGGSAWHVDAQAGSFRKAYDTSGNYSYIPLFEVKHPIRCIEKAFPNDLWQKSFPPWEPLDEDGEEDPVDMNMMEDSDSDFFEWIR